MIYIKIRYDLLFYTRNLFITLTNSIWKTVEIIPRILYNIYVIEAARCGMGVAYDVSGDIKKFNSFIFHGRSNRLQPLCIITLLLHPRVC